MKKIAIFASGSGSNFQAIVDSNLPVEISLLVCDNPQAKVIKRAKERRIAVHVFDPKSFAAKAEFEREILGYLRHLSIDFIILAGYMRLIGPTLLSVYSGKIINIHPSLLPSFPGIDAIGQALAHGVKVTGATVHFVDEGMDTGTIITQETVAISEQETKQTLQQKIQAVEHQLYVATIQQLLRKEWQ